MKLYSILNQMIHKEKNPPNTTISFESLSHNLSLDPIPNDYSVDVKREDTHSVVEIINVEKPDKNNPTKITLACKFLTEKIDLTNRYNNVDLTIDDFHNATDRENAECDSKQGMDRVLCLTVANGARVTVGLIAGGDF